jgi:Protein of unknown function (DUF4239)
MNLFVCLLIVLACVAIAVGVMLLVRRWAPEGSHFTNGDRASGVFGVLATGFAVLLGLVIVLAFTSFDQSRSGAETEALIVTQQFETAQFLPDVEREDLSGQLVCYARSVVYQEWPRLEDGTQGDAINPWAAEMFRTIRTADPQSVPEQTAYAKWLDQTSDREAARNDRTHGAVGVIPASLWIVLIFSAVIIFGYMLLFADSDEAWFVQATLMGSVVAVVVSSLLLINVLDQPFRKSVGGLQPVAMERALVILAEEQELVSDTEVPCDELGLPIS